MFEAGELLKLAHALIGVLFVAGLTGRWITLSYAARMTDVNSMRIVLGVSIQFERIVIGTSLFVLLLGLITAVAQGRPFLGPLQGAPVDWLFVSLLLYVSIIPLVPVVFLPRGRVFEAELETATARGEVTDGLKAAFNDPIVRWARLYELAAVILILALIIAKPF